MRAAQLIHDALDFCYPHRCERCDRPSSGPFLCKTCDGELSELQRRASCERCAMPLGGPGGDCPYCEGKGLRPFDRVIALGAFRDPLRHLIYAVKYHHRWPAAEWLAERMFELESVKGLLTETDCLVAVPLHRIRQISRGFNQAEVVAARLARKARIKVKHPAIRLRNTETQTHVHSRTKREENLKDAFGLIDEKSIRGKHIVLVDDVKTTGATLQSFARTLRDAEPASVSAIVLAVADPLGQDFQVI